MAASVLGPWSCGVTLLAAAVGCAPRSSEVFAVEPVLHSDAGQPVLTVVGVRADITERDRDDVIEYAEAAVLSFRGPAFAPLAAIDLPLRGEAKATVLPSAAGLPRLLAAAVARDAAGTPGTFVLVRPDPTGAFVTEPTMWDPALGASTPPDYLERIVSSEAGLVLHRRASDPRPDDGVPVGDELIGWSPDRGSRFIYTLPAPAGEPSTCPPGLTQLTTSSSFTVQASPGGHYLVVFGYRSVLCRVVDSSSFQDIERSNHAVVLDARTGAPLAPPLVVRGAALRYAGVPRFAVADDGTMLVLLPENLDDGTVERWAVRDPAGAVAWTFPPREQLAAHEVYAWGDGWLFRTASELVALARDGSERRRVAYDPPEVPIVVTRDSVYALALEPVEDPQRHFDAVRHCLRRLDAQLVPAASSCLDIDALAAALDR